MHQINWSHPHYQLSINNNNFKHILMIITGLDIIKEPRHNEINGQQFVYFFPEVK